MLLLVTTKPLSKKKGRCAMHLPFNVPRNIFNAGRGPRDRDARSSTPSVLRAAACESPDVHPDGCHAPTGDSSQPPGHSTRDSQCSTDRKPGDDGARNKLC